MSRFVHAQALNRRVTIQRNVLTRDAWGGKQSNWVDVASVWADIRFATGLGFANKEQHVTSNTEVSRPVASVKIRWRTGLTHAMRLVIGGAIYDIKAILPDEQDHRYVHIGVAIGANNG